MMLKIVIFGLTALLIVTTTATILGTPFTIMYKIISTAAAQQNTTAAASPNANTTFYLFTANHEGVNTTKTGIEPDAYSLETITVNKGDTVVVHFYNVDPTDRHTFTLGTPYNVNVDLAAGQHATFFFKADHEGVFGFFCKYHPAMVGHLAVLPPLSAS